MRLKIFYITLVSLFLLAACNTSDNASPAEQTDVKEMVNEYSAGNFGDEQASITSTELIIQENDEEKRYELPENEFFVSIAPFINQTHPCGDHSLTGCQGELANEDFEITITDADGNVVFDETRNAGNNGFVDLWLPRDQTYQVLVKHDGKTVESEVSTFEEDGTCVTTMQSM